MFRATSLEKPALAAWGGLLYLAWRTADAGRGRATLWCSAFDGRRWSGPRPVPGARSSHGPSLAAGDGGLHVYWKGEGGDERLWHTAFDGRFWRPAQVLFDGWPVTASRPCATVTHTSRVWLAFTGAGQDRTIHLCSSLDGAAWSRRDVVRVPQAASAWPSVVGRTGTGHRGADRLLLAWPDHDGRVWCALSEDAAGHWSQPAAVPARTLRGVGFAGWDRTDAYAAWAVGLGDDHSIHWAATAGGTSWQDPQTRGPLEHGQRRLEDRASLREPALAAYGPMWQ
ncbi:hypothetical protein AB0A77_34630 [Streptomyces varsoviensis]|uniref:hypothetical protein n=1 Tax=Streptomyces varsoviensis TaxID=67373 RepID=UPI0033E2BCBF